jgi:hypothetical protein
VGKEGETSRNITDISIDDTKIRIKRKGSCDKGKRGFVSYSE